jgi:hypothetical protein
MLRCTRLGARSPASYIAILPARFRITQRLRRGRFATFPPQEETVLNPSARHNVPASGIEAPIED